MYIPRGDRDPRPCEGCTATITGPPRQRYCCEACRIGHRRRGSRLSHAYRADRGCEGCTARISIDPNGRDTRRFCCPACRVAYRRRGSRLNQRYPSKQVTD
jgi:hypothetical protein